MTQKTHQNMFPGFVHVSKMPLSAMYSVLCVLFYTFIGIQIPFSALDSLTVCALFTHCLLNTVLMDWRIITVKLSQSLSDDSLELEEDDEDDEEEEDDSCFLFFCLFL